MFNNPKYLTKGVQSSIPGWLVILLWHLIEIMPVNTKITCKSFACRKPNAVSASGMSRNNRRICTRWMSPARMRWTLRSM